MMRRWVPSCMFLFLFTALVSTAAGLAQVGKAQKEGRRPHLDAMNVARKMTWYGHDTFKVAADKVIYFDPFKLKAGLEPADIILISHDHHDHCSPEDVKKIQKKDTIIVTTPDCAKKFSGNVRTMRPGEKLNLGTVQVEAVPAYNIGKEFHPKSKGWIGFIVTVPGGVRVYFAGDTDLIPEMKNIKADIALLPVSGTYVMTAEEAARAAEMIKPQIAVPMHYGSILGSGEDANKFRSLVTQVPVHIFEQIRQPE
ncbi:MAG: MBL fold metallo-hydrolase [Candidatus Eisenbacteria bacterium]|nr:MBL fold metallo-hydrolase [Candidatus Eisenbacteria bacterium]